MREEEQFGSEWLNQMLRQIVWATRSIKFNQIVFTKRDKNLSILVSPNDINVEIWVSSLWAALSFEKERKLDYISFDYEKTIDRLNENKLKQNESTLHFPDLCRTVNLLPLLLDRRGKTKRDRKETSSKSKVPRRFVPSRTAFVQKLFNLWQVPTERLSLHTLFSK